MSATARHAGALACLLVLLLRQGTVSPSVLAVAGSVGLVVCGAVALITPFLRALATAPAPPPDA